MAARVFVWLGGAWFAVSLIVCGAWYVFVLGRPARYAGAPIIAADAALFTVFALHHSVFARDFARRWLAPVPPLLLRSLYVWIASTLLILVCLLWRPIGGDLYRASGIAAAALVAVQLIGCGIIARAVAAIDPLELAGIRPPAATASAGGLKMSGVYGVVRHPLYFGWVLAAFGTPHMTGDRLAFAAISSLYLVVAVPWEERSLVRSFGDAYVRYQRDVRWRMIPFVY